MFVKRFLAGLVALVLVVGMAPAAFAASGALAPTRTRFSIEFVNYLWSAVPDFPGRFPLIRSGLPADVDFAKTGHQNVGWCYQRGILNAGGDGLMRPDDLISGAEVEAALHYVETVLTEAEAAGVRKKFEVFSHWAEIDLLNYTVYLRDGEEVVNSFLVALGKDATPTHAGEFTVRAKVPVQTMSGRDFYLPGVTWVSYFDGDISFHSCYWHSNWGTKQSHGCVNMRAEDAKVVYDHLVVGSYVYAY